MTPSFSKFIFVKAKLNIQLLYLTDFLKTNLTKFAAICVKKGSKGTFLEPKKLQNHSNEKQKERRKKRATRRKRGEEKKNNGCTLSFYNSYFLAEKNCWTQKVPLAITFSKKGVDIVLTQ